MIPDELDFVLGLVSFQKEALDNWVFHATPQANLASIRVSGLKPGKRGITKGKLFFSPYRKDAYPYGYFLLRFPWPQNYTWFSTDPAEYFTVDTIPPSQIEVQVGKYESGDWVALADTEGMEDEFEHRKDKQEFDDFSGSILESVEEQYRMMHGYCPQWSDKEIREYLKSTDMFTPKEIANCFPERKGKLGRPLTQEEMDADI